MGYEFPILYVCQRDFSLEIAWCSREFVLVRLQRKEFLKIGIIFYQQPPLCHPCSPEQNALQCQIWASRFWFQQISSRKMHETFISVVFFLDNNLFMLQYNVSMAHQKIEVTTVCFPNGVDIIGRKLVGSVGHCISEIDDGSLKTSSHFTSKLWIF